MKRSSPESSQKRLCRWMQEVLRLLGCSRPASCSCRLDRSDCRSAFRADARGRASTRDALYSETRDCSVSATPLAVRTGYLHPTRSLPTRMHPVHLVCMRRVCSASGTARSFFHDLCLRKSFLKTVHLTDSSCRVIVPCCNRSWLVGHRWGDGMRFLFCSRATKQLAQG